jgi:hypothetical protein
MASPGNWLADTFSSDAKEGDLVKSRSMNTTRMAAVVAPLLAGISTALGDVSDTPPFDSVNFQRQLILASVALIALVSTADIIGRSVAASRAQVPVGTLFPTPIRASKDVSGAADVQGSVMAFRSTGVAGDGEYLFVGADGTASWEQRTKITLL